MKLISQTKNSKFEILPSGDEVKITCNNPKLKLKLPIELLFDFVAANLNPKSKNLGIRRRAFQCAGYSLSDAIFLSDK
jgi:hypothetical protein